MSRPGRPRVGTRVAVRLPDDVLADIDERARAAGVSRAEALRTILGDALSRGSDGVDRTQIEARLALSPAERVRAMARDARRLEALRGRRRG